MIWILITRYLIEVFKVYFIFKKFTKYELKNKSIDKFILSSFLIVSITLFFLNFHYEIVDYQIVFLFSIFINLLIIFNGKKIEFIFSYFAIYFMVCIFDMFLDNMTVLIYSFFNLVFIDESLKMMFIEILSLLIILITSKILKKKRIDFRFDLRKYLFLIFTSFMLGGFIAYSRMILFNNNNSFYIIINLLFSIMWIIFLVVIFLYIFSQIKNEVFKSEIQHMSEINRCREEYYKMVTEKNRKIIEFKHDFKQHLNILNMLIISKKYCEAEKYLLKLNNSASLMMSNISTGNDIINSIVNDCNEKYKEHNIKFKCEGFFPEKIKICMMDTCTIFSNLIINAFEAAMKSHENRYVIIIVKQVNEFYMITLKNSFLIEYNPYKIFKESTKNDVDNHGFGISNARKKIEEYNGILDYKIVNNEVQTNILVKL